ncbi:protein-serine/threonine phosphatase [Entamoeba marina]
MASTEINYTECISRFIELELLHQDVIEEICKQFTRVLTREQNVVSIDGPVTIVGCLNGQLHDLLNIFDMAGDIPFTNYLFLGDYVNFGQFGLETILILMCYKIMHPTKITMLRGMNEIKKFAEIGGFQSECFSKYGNSNVYNLVIDTFKYLPIAADVQGEYFCSHGGILKDVTIENLRVLSRVKTMKKKDTLTWFLIAESKEEKYSKYFKWFERTDQYVFSDSDVEYFLKENKNQKGGEYKMVINTNSLQPLGQVISDNQKLNTIWSSADFLGEFKNLGCYLDVSDQGKINAVQFSTPPRHVLPTKWKPLRDSLPKAVPDFFLLINHFFLTIHHFS